MKIGIFGGSFNPPHKMHFDIANQLIEKKYVDTIIFVPTGKKYEYKNNLNNSKDRLKMLELMIQDHKEYQVSDYEFKEQAVYTYQTLDYFQEQYPDSEIYFICGSDNLSYLDQWNNSEYLLDHYQFIVVRRNTDEIEPLLEKYKEKKDHIIISDIEPIELSSSLIRDKIKVGKLEECKDLLSEEVYSYIKENHLYEK